MNKTKLKNKRKLKNKQKRKTRKIKGGVDINVINYFTDLLLSRFKEANQPVDLEQIDKSVKLPDYQYGGLAGLKGKYQNLPFYGEDLNKYIGMNVVNMESKNMSTIKNVRYNCMVTYSIKDGQTYIKKTQNYEEAKKYIKQEYQIDIPTIEELKQNKFTRTLIKEVTDTKPVIPKKYIFNNLFGSKTLPTKLKIEIVIEQLKPDNCILTFDIESNNSPGIIKTMKYDKLKTFQYDKIYIVYGMGCDLKKELSTERLLYNISKYYDIPYGVLEIICHDFTETLRNILFLWVQNIIFLSRNVIGLPLTNIVFLNDYYTKILTELKNNKKILLLGNSFGGAIVNRIAMEINESLEQQSKNLEIIAFSSIFVAPYSKVNKINLTNFLILGDVAQKLNSQFEPLPQSIENYDSISTDDYTFRINRDFNKTIRWVDIYNKNNERYFEQISFKSLLNYDNYAPYLDGSNYLNYFQKTFSNESSLLQDTSKLLYDIPYKLSRSTLNNLIGSEIEWTIHNLGLMDRYMDFKFL